MVERQTFNLNVVGSTPTSGESLGRVVQFLFWAGKKEPLSILQSLEEEERRLIIFLGIPVHTGSVRFEIRNIYQSCLQTSSNVLTPLGPSFMRTTARAFRIFSYHLISLQGRQEQIERLTPK
jgi:hypothetical protein